MKNKIMILLGCILMILTGCPNTDSDNNNTVDNGPKIKSAKLYNSSVMERTDYEQGEPLSLEGVRLKVTYTDGETKSSIYYSKEPESFTIPDITKLSLGEHKVICKYKGVDFEVSITIYPARTKNKWETTKLDDLSPNINHEFWDNANIYFVMIVI